MLPSTFKTGPTVKSEPGLVQAMQCKAVHTTDMKLETEPYPFEWGSLSIQSSSPSNTFLSNTFTSNTSPSNTFLSNTFTSNTFTSNTFTSNTFTSKTFPSKTFTSNTFPSNTFPSNTTQQYPSNTSHQLLNNATILSLPSNAQLIQFPEDSHVLPSDLPGNATFIRLPSAITLQTADPNARVIKMPSTTDWDPMSTAKNFMLPTQPNRSNPAFIYHTENGQAASNPPLDIPPSCFTHTHNPVLPAYYLFCSQKYAALLAYIRNTSSFPVADHQRLQKLFYMTLYEEAAQKRGGQLSAGQKYRIRGRNPVPHTISSTAYRASNTHSEQVRRLLDSFFKRSRYLRAEEVEEIMEATFLTRHQVKNYFKNKRSRTKDHSEWHSQIAVRPRTDDPDEFD